MTLADLSEGIHKALKWFLLAIAVVILLWISWGVIKNLSGLIFKPGGEKIAFGKLTPPFFVKAYPLLRANTFKISVKLPESPAEANVYLYAERKGFTEKQQNTLLKSLSLSAQSKQESGNVTTWQNNTKTATLKINSKQNTFTYYYDYANDPSVFGSNISTSDEEAVKKAGKILDSLKLFPNDLKKGESAVRFLKISGKNKEEVSGYGANAIEVSFYRKIEKMVSLGDPCIKILFTVNEKILEFNYAYSSIDPAGSPYPIISSNDAYKELEEGRAYTQSNKIFDRAEITNAKLSYWESNYPQTFLQPVWVFSGKGKTAKGDESLTAYVLAVSPSYVAK